jgi:hypothetical protein
MGQVPFTGSAHCGFIMATLDSMVQQSWPAPQHCAPQQNAPITLHSAPGGFVHAGSGAHVPLSQYGCVPEQTFPQAPQLLMSL